MIDLKEKEWKKKIDAEEDTPKAEVKTLHHKIYLKTLDMRKRIDSQDPPGGGQIS